MKRDIFTRIIEDESGATAIEYGIIVALIAVVAIAGAQTMGANLLALFNRIAGDLAPLAP